MINEKALLKIRARELAKPDKERSSDEGVGKEMLEFLLSGERYAIDTTFVSEAINILEMTPIPGTPAYLDGVMNVRGRIVPVINLKKFFRLKEEGIAATTKVVILCANTYEVAILTDAILSTRWLTESSIKPTPSTLRGIGAEHLLGVTQDALIIIDGRSLIGNLESSLTNRKSLFNP